MIHVDVPTPTTQEFRDWQDLARAETARAERAVRAGEKYEVNDKLYKAQRDELLNAFHDKCAYCEAKIDVTTRRGDLEHYRPKGRVLDERGKIVMIGPEHALKRHPGYYWLAYDWSNFLSSCPACNRRGEDRDGLKSGKRDCFPLEGTFRAVERGQESQESPLILNPRVDDPDLHLVFDWRKGIIGHKTTRGKMTVTLLGLNRKGLPEKRRSAFDAALRATLDYLEADEAIYAPAEIEKRRLKCNCCRRGEVEFGAFAREGVREARAYYERRLARLDHMD